MAALRAPWHQRHEDVTLVLQKLRDPRSVPVLYEAALSRHEYLAYDENFNLARKCTWALADVGTPEARACLEKLSRSESPKVAAYAAKRLAKWVQEMPRKGPRD